MSRPTAQTLGRAPDRATRPWGIDRIVGRLRDSRRAWREAHHGSFEADIDGFPSRSGVDGAIVDLKAALYPQRLGDAHGRADEEDYVVRILGRGLDTLHEQVRRELRFHEPHASAGAIDDEAGRILAAFAATLPDVRALIDGDVRAAFLCDPAAGSVDEILICYPGTHALIHQRLAHRLYRLGAPLVARMLTERAHSRTGIDIHPGAEIGPDFFIDHGTGVVIGETARIGARVRLYQAVTLGARRLPPIADGGERQRVPRHPIIEDDVVIYAGATILGRVTVGRGSVIGGGVWLVDDVPPGSQVSQGEVRLRMLTRVPGEDGGRPARP